MNRHSSTRDVTATQRVRGEGLPVETLWLCGHKGSSTGALYRPIPGLRPIPYMCASCNAARKAAGREG